MNKSIKEIADTLDSAALNSQTTQQVSLNQTISLDDAYEIQKMSLENRYARGEKLTGYKLGFTSKAKMEQMGVHDIIWGRLTDGMQYESGQALPSEKFIHPRVEPEIAFLIGKRIDRAIALDEATDFLKGVASALEVIDSRYENFKFSLEDVIADNCSSSAYAFGDWMPPNTEVNHVAIELKINGETKQTGSSSAILDNPLAALVEITRLMHDNGIVLEEGTVILAGAATSAEFIHPGDKIEGHFVGLSTVHLSVE